MRDNTRKVALWQVARTKVDNQLPLQRAGKVGDLPYRLIKGRDNLLCEKSRI